MLTAQGRQDEAAECFGKAIKYQPDLARAHVYLGEWLKNTDNLDEAERHLRTAVRLAPDDFFGYIALGSLLLLIRQFDESVKMCKKALALGPAEKMPDVYHTLGAAQRASGQFEDALQSLQKLDRPLSRSTMMECLLELGRYDAFFTAVENELEVNPLNIRAAAISAYASNQLARNDPHPFCPDPLSHIRIVENFGLDDTRQSQELVAGLIDAYEGRKTRYEPKTNATTKGYQTFR